MMRINHNLSGDEIQRERERETERESISVKTACLRREHSASVFRCMTVSNGRAASATWGVGESESV
ncbi:hypothetical protein EYF80_005997 [Liparis tanakae]|uniref:Uncharacterized protein n=1 Tax=Liparis tanakae TaxID=230148 RepID=A0A4Z2J1H3_9TELE|nr:hypothetical protein EYF80_005997 [Liparis tanakae]